MDGLIINRHIGQRDRTTQLFLISSTWLLAATLNAYIIVPASFFPIIIDRLAISPTAASWLVSVIFALGVIAGVPVGVALDRIDNRIAIMIATSGLLLACGWGWQAALSGSYWSLLGARAVAGLAFPLIWNASMNLISRTFNANTRATAIGVFTTSAPAGFALGQIMGPVVSSQIGWEAAFGIYALPICLAGGFFWNASRRVPKRDPDVNTPDVNEFLDVLTNRRVQSVAAMGFLAYSIYVFFNTWMPTYLTEQLGLPLTMSGVLIAIFPAIGILSRGSSGFISDVLLTQRRQPLVYIAFFISFPLVMIIAVTNTIILVICCLVFLGLFVQLGVGILFTYVQDLVHPNVGATALAVLTMMSSLGSFTAPVVAGFLIEQTQTYLAAFMYIAFATGVGTILAHRGPEPNRYTDS